MAFWCSAKTLCAPDANPWHISRIDDAPGQRFLTSSDGAVIVAWTCGIQSNQQQRIRVSTILLLLLLVSATTRLPPPFSSKTVPHSAVEIIGIREVGPPKSICRVPPGGLSETRVHQQSSIGGCRISSEYTIGNDTPTRRAHYRTSQVSH